MPIYSYKCPQCDYKAEIVMSIRAVLRRKILCKGCRAVMKRDFRADMPNAGGRRYGTGFVSESLAISPLQIAEHKQNFPDIDVRGDGCILFKDIQQHDKYLKKLGWNKPPQKTRRKKACIKS